MFPAASLAGKRGAARRGAHPSFAPFLQARVVPRNRVRSWASPEWVQLEFAGRRNKGAGVWAGSHVCGKGRWEKPSTSCAGQRGRGLPTALGELPAGCGQSRTQVKRDGLGAGTGCGNGPGEQEVAEKRGFESPESFCGMGSGAEVSPLPSSLLSGLATALTSSRNKRRHIQSCVKQHCLGSSKEIPSGVGYHKKGSPSPSPPQWREKAGAGGMWGVRHPGQGWHRYPPGSHHSAQRAHGSKGPKAPIAARVGWRRQCCH